MNKTEYMARRAALLAEAQAAIDANDMAAYEAKENEINALDEQFEAQSKAQANMNALKTKAVDTGVVKDFAGDNGVVVTDHKDQKSMYLTAWAKRMMGQSLTDDERVVFDKVNREFENLGPTIQTAATHAVVIPESVTGEIWRIAKDLYPLLADVDMTFVPGDLTILRETNSGDDAAWYDEDTEVVDGSFTITPLNLTGCELAKSIPISWKLRKMSIERFIPYITELLADKMGAALAKGIVNGRGKPGASDTFKPEPLGVKTAILAEENNPQVEEYAELDGIDYDTLALAMGKVKSAYKSGAAIYATSATIWSQLALIKDAEGRPVFIPDVTAGGIGRIFGLPVKEDDSIDDGEVLIGNLTRGYACNVNENMTIYTEDHVKARYTDYMDYAIVDGAPLTTKAFALIVVAED